MWSQEMVLALIELYRHHDNLYDTRHPDYLDQRKREKSLKQLQEQLLKFASNITINCVRNKIHTMRSQYIKEIKEMNDCLARGESYEPKLWFFSQMHYLKEHCMIRIQKRSLGQTHDELAAKRLLSGGPPAESLESDDELDGSDMPQGMEVYGRLRRKLDKKMARVQQILVKRLEEGTTDYDWLGKQVVFEMKNIRSEEIRRKTAWRVQTILREAILEDTAVSVSHTNGVSQPSDYDCFAERMSEEDFEILKN